MAHPEAPRVTTGRALSLAPLLRHVSIYAYVAQRARLTAAARWTGGALFAPRDAQDPTEAHKTHRGARVATGERSAAPPLGRVCAKGLLASLVRAPHEPPPRTPFSSPSYSTWPPLPVRLSSSRALLSTWPRRVSTVAAGRRRCRCGRAARTRATGRRPVARVPPSPCRPRRGARRTCCHWGGR